MKTVTQFAVAGLATVLLAGAALASDGEWLAIDNHHGSITYIHRPAQKETTVAVYARGKSVGRTEASAKADEVRFQQVATAHGPISYFAPVE